LNFKNNDLLDRPPEERKKYLADVAEAFTAPIQQIMMFPDDVDLETATQVVRQTRIEGLVAKRRGSFYLPGKEVDFWRKHRVNQEDKFFIGGYIPGSLGIGELLIGEFREDKKFYFVKRLIAGLNRFNRREIYDSVQDLKNHNMPLRESAGKSQRTPIRTHLGSDGRMRLDKT
jgi:bifunctional non-homologous end joining protein LigD